MFQDGIWLVYFNVVVCVRIQRRKKKKSKEKKKRERKKGKVPKRRKLKGFSSNFEKWNGRKEHCFEEVEVKKKCWMQIPKRVDIPTNLENTSYIYLHPFLFNFLYFYPTLHPNKVLIWSWRLCSSDIDMTD